MIKIAIAGDYVTTNRVKALVEEQQYEQVMGDVRQWCKSYDYSLVNLECPVLPANPKPIVKCGPNLSCSENSLKMLQYAGFNCACLANNHFYDYGEDGVKDTLDALQKLDIDHVGGGMDLAEASATLFKKVGTETLAVINCAEHESSIATKYSGGSNPLNPIAQYYAIQEARKKADYVIVITHGGVEQYELPTPRMQETFRFFIDAGADAVINHHQHCPTGYEQYKGKPIFYGLGNFCFDSKNYRNSNWNEGYVVSLCFDRGKVNGEIHPYTQCNEKPAVVFMEGEERRLFIKKMEKANVMIADEEALEKAHLQYMDSTWKRHVSLFTPYAGRWTMSLCEKGLLPTLFPKKKWPTMLNMIECESHRERIIHFIKDKMNK